MMRLNFISPKCMKMALGLAQILTRRLSGIHSQLIVVFVAAQYYLAYMYESGEKIPQDYQKAIQYYFLAARRGDSDAQYRLGNIYFKGKGIDKEYEKAFEFFVIAAENDNAEGIYSLGMMYENGFGVQQNFVIALKWYIIGSNRHGEHKAINSRDRLLTTLDEKEILIAKTMASRWQPKKSK